MTAPANSGVSLNRSAGAITPTLATAHPPGPSTGAASPATPGCNSFAETA
jgi:hypothetical protein